MAMTMMAPTAAEPIEHHLAVLEKSRVLDTAFDE